MTDISMRCTDNTNDTGCSIYDLRIDNTDKNILFKFKLK